MAKQKKVSYAVVAPLESGQRSAPYRMLDELLTVTHRRLKVAEIVLVWRLDVKPDKDGVVWLGKAKKASDIDRHGLGARYDFAGVLNQEEWDGLLPANQLAVMDELLCEMIVVLDDEGSPKEDEGGRLVTRIRKHPCKVFPEVIARHGLYLQSHEDFADSIQESAIRGEA